MLGENHTIGGQLCSGGSGSERRAVALPSVTRLRLSFQPISLVGTASGMCYHLPDAGC